MLLAAMAARRRHRLSAEQTQPQKLSVRRRDVDNHRDGRVCDKTLTFNGKELPRAYVLYHNKTVEVGGQQVALFDAGDGGNQCGTATVIVWKPENGEIQSVDCRRRLRLAAASHHRQKHLFRALPPAGRIEGRANMDADRRAAGRRHAVVHAATRHRLGRPRPSKLDNIVDAFDNEAVYEAGAEAARRRHAPISQPGCWSVAAPS